MDLSICRIPFWNAALLFVLLSGGNHLAAQMIPLKNPEFKTAANLPHAKPASLDGWQTEQPKMLRTWRGPGEAWHSIAIGGGGALSQNVQLPALSEAQAKHSAWDLVVAIDVLGKFTPSESPGVLSMEILSASNEKSLARLEQPIEHRAAKSFRADWIIRASSSERKADAHAVRAFDQDPKTIWHSRYSGSAQKLPQFLSVDFGKPKTLGGFRYLPRPGRGNGTIKDYEIQSSNDGKKWISSDKGRFNYDSHSEWQQIQFSKPITTRFIRLVSLSEINGQDFASCAEWSFDFAEQGNADVAPVKTQRCFLVLPAEKIPADGKIRIRLQVDSMRYVVVDQAYLFAIPRTPSPKLFGKPNGGLGPDGIGAGSYGFRGFAVHHQPALPVISVTPGSPAAIANLRAGDTIVGINQSWLPANDIAPGWNWFENSHEAVLGRAAIESIKASQDPGKVSLQVLRHGKLHDIDLQLKLPKEIADKSFLLDRSKNQLLRNQLLVNVLKSQSTNGSWNRDPKRTALGGLALLSTRDQKYAPQIKSAANWLLSHHANPDTGFFWHPAYSGIFLSEYYLATGDQRVLPWMKRHLDHVQASYHNSKWNTKTLGHGPRGLPYGNKSLVAPMVHILLFESLAKRCGIESSIWENVEPFVESAWSDPAKGGHGGLGYNASYKDQNEFWSRSGLLALALNLRNDRTDMQKSMVSIMERRHPWLRNSHAYGEPGGGLGLLALSTVDSKVFERVLPQYSWWFALSWQDRYGLKFTTPHMGAPYMETDSLINNLYAIVLNAPAKTLHLTGSRATNWLDVSAIKVPLSPIQFFDRGKGQFELRAVIPGPEIRYTLDGSDPTPSSNRYLRPIRVPEGSTIKACTFDGAQSSKVSTYAVALNRDEWKIVDATGHQDRQLAIEQATHAINGDRFIPWITNSGEGAKGFPHSIVIDLGREVSFSRLRIRFPFDGMSATNLSVFVGPTASQLESIGKHDLSKFSQSVSLNLGSRKSRFLKVQFDKPRSDKQVSLMVGGIELFAK